MKRLLSFAIAFLNALLLLSILISSTCQSAMDRLKSYRVQRQPMRLAGQLRERPRRDGEASECDYAARQIWAGGRPRIFFDEASASEAAPMLTGCAAAPTSEALLASLLDSQPELTLEEATLSPGSPGVGKTLGSLALREKHALVPLALRVRGKDFLVDPPPGTRLRAGDVLLVLGKAKDARALQKRLNA